MKSYNHLTEQYLSDENYYLAVRNATIHKGGKKRKHRKARYYRDHAKELKPELMEYTEYFCNEEHVPKEIYDGIRRKQRQIIVPSMREQIVHHMVVNVLKPIFMKGMYEHSYGSLPGRGAHLAKRHIEKWIRRSGRDCKYCLKMDVRKYFDSVPHDILKAKLRKLIHDRDFLLILEEIVDAVPGDRGIPIGFYTSQWFANWYLTELDHYIKEQLHAKFYVRYMDDMVIFGGNKRELHRIRKQVDEYLHERLGLELKGNWQVFRFHYVKKNGQEIGRDLDFMGFQFYRNRTTLRRTIMLKATRKARKIARKGRTRTVYDCRQMLSYLGWIDAADVYGMYKQRIKPNVSFQRMKRSVGNYDRRMEKEGQKRLPPVAGEIRTEEERACGNTQKTAATQDRQTLTKPAAEPTSTSGGTSSSSRAAAKERKPPRTTTSGKK